MNKETSIMHAIMLALSDAGCMVWRNETSGAWVGKVAHKAANQVTLKDAHMMRFGLSVGSCDVIGIAPNGRFLAVEVKTSTGRLSKEQANFIAQVNLAGGIAGVARSPAEALQLIERETHGINETR